MSDDKTSSQVEDTLDDLAKMAYGVAGKLLGPKATKGRVDPDKPVVSEEVDQVLEDIGSSMGRILKAAGDGLLGDQADETAETPDDEGWSPLATGAKHFAKGLTKLGNELASQAKKATGSGDAETERDWQDPDTDEMLREE